MWWRRRHWHRDVIAAVLLVAVALKLPTIMSFSWVWLAAAIAARQEADQQHATDLDALTARLTQVEGDYEGARGQLASVQQALADSSAELDRTRLTEPAEVALLTELDQRRPAIESAVASGQGFRQAFSEAARLGPTVAKFFDDVMVMTEDQTLRHARLSLVAALRDLILEIADLSEIATER